MKSIKCISEQEWKDEFKRRLRDRMEYLEISQTELSRISGVSNQLICRYLKGENVPSAYHAILLSKALIMPLDKLINF